ncbi:MAG: endo-1,4-beta-xylanase [Chloroflexi bacterium]|nr:endo-1,4-beta-xylanase [Chloroflexota bacterium]
MKHTLIFVLLVNLLLGACTPASTPTPAPSATPVPSVTPVPSATATNTSVPTAMATVTPVATPTRIPTIQIGDLTVTDPRYSAPELFDLSKPDAPIPQFVNAMQMAGIEITAEQVAEGITFREVKGKEGEAIAVAIYNLDPNPLTQGETLEGSIPFMIAKKNTEWRVIGLRDLAAELGLILGTHFSSDNYPYRELKDIDPLVIAEFNGAMIDQLAWNIIEQKEGVFVFNSVDGMYEKSADATINKAMENGMYIRGTHLIDARSNFTYSYLRDLKGLTRERLLAILENHVRTIMTHFKGMIKLYGVVSESRSPEAIHDGRPDDMFNVVIGKEYIEAAFRVARDTDPQALLFYNDTRNEILNSQPYQWTKQIIDRLRLLGLVDGVGIQLHLDGANPPSKHAIIDAFKGYGIPVYITELDVNMSAVSKSSEERHQIQAKIYKEAIDACLESGVCEQIWFWDVFDKYSWLDNARGGNALADPTMFDDSLNKKPAYFAVLEALQEKMPR